MTKVRKLKGRRSGERHQAAYLTDHDVELMRQLREEDKKVWTYEVLAVKFDSKKPTVAAIVTYRRR